MDKFYIKYANAMDLLMSDTPMKPTKIFDNLAALGGIGTIMYVLEVGEDLYLFDALLPGQAFVDIYENGMKALGYDPRKVKALYISHGHFDHYGIVDYLVETYGIPVYMSKTDYDFSFGDCASLEEHIPILHKIYIGRQRQTVHDTFITDLDVKHLLGTDIDSPARNSSRCCLVRIKYQLLDIASSRLTMSQSSGSIHTRRRRPSVGQSRTRIEELPVI